MTDSRLQQPPLSAYIHIPWCIKKCPYCDFNSHENTVDQHLPEKDYLERIKLDLEQDRQWIQGRKLESIFFGGGTPSLFSASAIGAILDHLEDKVGFAENIEITLEANPGTFEQKKFADFYHAGINRLSVGVQSFQENHLKKLGRIHNKDEALYAISRAQQSGFANINIDLMHGLPEQTPANAMEDLSTAIALGPQHISWYQLTIEQNTVFYRSPPPLPPEDTLATIQAIGLQQLADKGYRQYEVSAFAHNGQQSKHNCHYWEFGDYIGLGAGAHGKYTDIDNNAIIRRQKTRRPNDYLYKHSAPSYKEHRVDPAELPLEFLMNSLRLLNGVPRDYFTQRTGLPLPVLDKTLARAIRQGLVELSPQRIKTSPLGQQFLNTILTQLMEDDSYG